ncbi:MAG TPA: TonB-dependent receptor, partial [Bacteroidota bacterium]
MKMRTVSSTVLLLVFLAISALGQDGKIAGTVVDKERKEPLIGANVSIVGTSYGAATDIEGRYVILTVPPGTYDVKASYIGYQDVIMRGVTVTAGLTQTFNFELQSTAIELPTLEIVSQRPLVERSATNVTRVIKGEEIEQLPVRGIGAYIALQAGVVEQNGNIHIRGSRPDEVGYMVEGANTKNLRGSGNLVTTIPEAIEEVVVQSGGYGAEFGGSNAGIVQQSLKTGSSQFTTFLQYETDNLGNYPNETFLDTYSYGYSNLVVSVSGPVQDNIRFFLAGENAFVRDYNPVFWSGADFGNLVDNGFRSGRTDTSIAPVAWGPGNISGRFANRYTGNGTLLLDYNPLRVRLAGSYTWGRTKINNSPIANIFNQGRLPYNDNSSLFLNGKATYFLGEKSLVDVNLSMINTFTETYDPNFGSDIFSYSDSTAAAAHGWTYENATTPPYDYTFSGFYFARPGALASGYSKSDRASFSISADYTAQMGRHELKAGVSYERWTFRNYAIGGLTGLLQSIRSRPGIQDNRQEFLQFIRQSANLDNYGYDELGDKLDSGLDGPKHPYFASVYVQDKIEFDDIILNAGVRIDNMFFDSWRMVDPANPLYDPINLQVGNLVTGTKYTFVQPRLGFSFVATDRTVFHLQYGKFVQAPDLNTVYKGRRAAYQYFLFAFNNPLGYDLSPIETTQYELGFTQQFTDYAAFDITGFYRDVKGLVQVDRQLTVPGSPVLLYH